MLGLVLDGNYPGQRQDCFFRIADGEARSSKGHDLLDNTHSVLEWRLSRLGEYAFRDMACPAYCRMMLFWACPKSKFCAGVHSEVANWQILTSILEGNLHETDEDIVGTETRKPIICNARSHHVLFEIVKAKIALSNKACVQSTDAKSSQILYAAVIVVIHIRTGSPHSPAKGVDGLNHSRTAWSQGEGRTYSE